MAEVIIDYLNRNNTKRTLNVAKGESLTYLLLGLQPGAKEVIVNLNGRGAEAQILGIFLGKHGTETIKMVQRHRAPNTTSNLLVRSILQNQSSYHYHGMIRIEKSAQGANAYQRNDNLLLSENAKVNTHPELEILNDDVKCTHGATTGKINEASLFYLTSRGISKAKAEQLIVEGFLKDILERIPDNKRREELFNELQMEINNA